MASDLETWNCPTCTLANEGGVTCPMCYENRPGTWPCPLCQMINLPSRAVCREDGCGGCQPAAPRADDVWKPAGAPDDVPEDPSASLRVAIEAGNVNEAERLLRLFGIGVPKEGPAPNNVVPPAGRPQAPIPVRTRSQEARIKVADEALVARMLEEEQRAQIPVRTRSQEARIKVADEALVTRMLEEEQRAQREREAAYTFTCVICLEERPVQGSFTGPGDCNHRICAECFVEMMATHINEGNVDGGSLCCSECREPYTPIAIDRSLRENGHDALAQRYLDILTDRGLRSDQDNFRCCPHPGCNLIFAWSAGDPKHYECVECKHAFCLECTAAGDDPTTGPAHPRQTCEERRAVIEEDKNAREQRLVRARNDVAALLDPKCPRCQAVFDGFEGCAALSCPRCPCRFCALCLQDCGGDAHQHVRECPQRGNAMRDDYFLKAPEMQVWQGVLVPQRRAKLERFWAGLDPAMRVQCGSDAFIQGTYRDHGLAHLLA